MDTLKQVLLALLFAVVRVVPTYAQQPTVYGQQVRSVAAWTSATAVSTALTLTTTTFASVTVTVNGVAPITGGQIWFQGDDSAGVWWPVEAYRVDTGIPDTVVNLAPLNQAWQISAAGWTSLRVFLAVPITGAGTVNIGMTPTAATSVVNTTSGATAAGLRPVQVPPGTAALGLFGTFNQRIGSVADSLKVYVNNPVDPCGVSLKGNVAISQTANTRLLVGVPGKRFYVCSFFVVGADAENLSVVEGTGTTCGTSTVAVIGGTTAAAGPNMAANAGWTQGIGLGTIAVAVQAGDDVCLFQSGSGRVAGNLTYVVQ